MTGKTALKDQAYIRILEWIEQGELKRGSVTSEAKLCAKLGMSRTPIRSALQRLEWEGYVRIVPKHGVLVLDASAARAGTALDLAAALLVHAMAILRRCAYDETAAKEARAAAYQCRRELGELASRVPEAADAKAYAGLERRFLTALVGLVHSAELTALFERKLALADSSGRDGPRRWKPPHRQQMKAALEALLAAFEEEDADAEGLAISYFRELKRLWG